MNRRNALCAAAGASSAASSAVVIRPATALAAPTPALPPVSMREYAVPAGSHPHDVACATQTADEPIWFTAQSTGHLGWLNPVTEEVRLTPLAPPGQRSAPHGVIVGPDGFVWITDGGLNALHRFDPETETFESFPHPRPNAEVRQLLGRPGEVWGALSTQDKLMVMRRS